MAREAYSPFISKDLADFRQGNSDVHRGLSAGLFEPCPPPQCASISLRTGGFHRDAGERRKRNHADAGPELIMKSDDIHTVSRNASSTRPARFLVFLVKGKALRPLVLEK